MSRPQQVARPIVRSLRQATGATATCASRPIALRPFSSTPNRKDETTTTPDTPAQPSSEAQKLASDAALLGQKKASPITSVIKQGTEDELSQLLSPQLGSRRRQARKILAQDREEKVAKIVAETAKIKRLEAADASTFRGGQA
ncbi:hypothetical protein NEMBOFW57_005338 [Staphylotrichum longicolle]|uniref:Uncharacterized protein n=1 Tax=Staphylotrichum longicolle TaxID=669026 RepID=A0AAD4I1E4_9PEZI|nr:hypothetical protein NEMBOFW57_005338 [Staphylotrichum longicolle]